MTLNEHECRLLAAALRRHRDSPDLSHGALADRAEYRRCSFAREAPLPRCAQSLSLAVQSRFRLAPTRSTLRPSVSR